jgi:DNA-binding SARP family transcriptional activator
MVRVLGPIDLEIEGTSVPIGSRLGRMLLATLTLAANHLVPADQIATVLWGDAPPTSRDNTLQTYVSRLRHLVGHDRIRAGDHCYQLSLAPAELDALVFETLVSDAMEAHDDPGRCLDICKGALALWRGAAFGEFAERDPFRLEAIRLSELRFVAMETRFECELDLGREELVTGALEAMVEEYPYRERLWHLYVSALALSGRRVEALRACSRLRSLLAEVGLEPSAVIRELETAIFVEAPRVRTRVRTLLVAARREPGPTPASAPLGGHGA